MRVKELSESQRKKIFWTSLIIISMVVVSAWGFLFLGPDIERLRSVQFSLPQSDFPKEIGDLKALQGVFKENIDVFKNFVGDVKSLESGLTEEEKKKFEEWTREQETKGEEVTLEATLEFLQELRSSGSTTMPLQNKQN